MFNEAYENFMKQIEEGKAFDWNIEGIAKNVMKEMKDDGEKDLDNLDYYLRRIVVNGLSDRASRDEADEVAEQVADRIGELWEEE